MKESTKVFAFLLAIGVVVAGAGFYYEQVTPTAPPSAVQGETASTPTACNAGSWVINVAEDGTGVITLSCSAVSQEVASNPNACGGGSWLTQVTESSAGALTLTCSAVLQETASSPTACSAGSWLTQVTEASTGVLTLVCSAVSQEASSTPSACSAGQFMTLVTESSAGALTLTCASHTNFSFVSNTSTCTISSASANLGAFTTSPTYTTQGTPFLHNVMVTLNFEIDPPAVANINTVYQFAYGTSTAPLCAASNAGTSVGNSYTVIDIGEVGSGSFQGKWPESVTVIITGLTASTTYWFDLKVTDSSTASWIYLKPQISVAEI